MITQLSSNFQKKTKNGSAPKITLWKAFKKRVIETAKSKSNLQAIHDICYDLKANLQENAEKICEMTRKEN